MNAKRSGAFLAMALLGGCYQVGTLEGTQVETVKVDGRRFEVRIGQTDKPNQWRMVITRATMVIDPDPALESQRAQEVAKRFMERTCKGGPYEEILAGLQGGVNYRTLFRCT